jgi:RNA polymerase sigma factor (sigma-70 family)
MPTTQSDEEVMSQVREGAAEMLGILFERYHAKLFNYYVRLTGDRTLSEDLVQEAFYKILRSRRTYRPGSPFRPWMYQIARNARTDNFRRPAEVEFQEHMAEPVLLEDELADREQHEILRRALLQLPEEKRELLLLTRFEGLKYSEIAQMFDCEVGTIKTRIFRALQELKQIVADNTRPPHPRTRDAYEM